MELRQYIRAKPELFLDYNVTDGTATIKRGRGRPIGVLIALSEHEIGWSLCHVTLEQFNKKIGVEIATGRAKNPNPKLEVPPTIIKELEYFKDRAKRYFTKNT